MKMLIDYQEGQPEGVLPWIEILRDILAELEANSRNIKQLDTCLSAELATINTRIAKLEEARKPP